MVSLLVWLWHWPGFTFSHDENKNNIKHDRGKVFFRWQQQQSHKTWRTTTKNSNFRPFIKTVESGAQTTIFCAVEVFCYFQRISHYIFINNRASHLLPWCFCSRRALRASQADTIQTAGSFQRSFSVSSMKYTFDMNDAYLSCKFDMNDTCLSSMKHIWHEWRMCVIRYDPCLTCIACHL